MVLVCLRTNVLFLWQTFFIDMERIDYLPNRKDLKIIQDDEMFCINTDTEVLGEFLNIYRDDIVLDIGTNTGALLLYASRFHPKKLIGIDINDRAIEIAKRNMELNNVEATLIKADGNSFKLDKEADVVIMNPPYFNVLSNEQMKNDYLRLAKHEENFPLSRMIKAIGRNLRNGGTLFFLFETKRMVEVINLLEEENIKVKEMKFVFDENKENSNVFLVRAVKNAKAGVVVKKPIIITR